MDRDISEARSRAAQAARRAQYSAARAERYERLSREGVVEFRELNARLARSERATRERQLASARIQEAWVERLERSARGDDPAVLPILASAVAECAGVSSLAVTVWASGGTVAALVGTDERSRSAQDLEVVIGSGPAYESARTGTAVRAPAEVLRSRWPDYATHAADLGIYSVSAVPLGFGPLAFGSVAVFDRPFTEQVIDLHRLQTVADAFAEGVLEDLASDGGKQLSGLLTGDRAYLLHNAAGRIAFDEQCDVGSALAMIRARAFAEGTSAVELSRQILDEGLNLSDPG